MSNNPLAGLSIPSLKEIVDRVVEGLEHRIIDLSNPLQRQRLKDRIERHLGGEFKFELERAIGAATERAVKHVFDVVRDADYQAKKKARQEYSRHRRADAKKRKEAAEAEARMDYSKRNFTVDKVTLQ